MAELLGDEIGTEIQVSREEASARTWLDIK